MRIEKADREQDQQHGQHGGDALAGDLLYVIPRRTVPYGDDPRDDGSGQDH